MDINEILKSLTLNANINPPCSEEEIQKFERETRIQLPDTLIRLYRHCNGTKIKKGVELPFNLMTLEEVRELLTFSDWYYEELQKNLQDNDKICAFWSDGNSNYAAVYLSGLLEGKICFIDHEETDLSPVFRDFTNFYQSIFEIHALNLRQPSAESGWWDMKTDYPKLVKDENEEFYFEDLLLAEKFIELFREETGYEKKQHLAFCAMNLLPLSETDKILEFVRSDDMWIQERACQLLGEKKSEKAIPVLAEVARSGNHNGKIAAMIALRNFNTQESKFEIERLLNEVEDDYRIYLKPNYQQNL